MVWVYRGKGTKIMSQNRNEQASREFFSGTAPIEGLHEMKFGVFVKEFQALGDTPLDPKIVAQFLMKTAQRLMATRKPDAGEQVLRQGPVTAYPNQPPMLPTGVCYHRESIKNERISGPAVSNPEYRAAKSLELGFELLFPPHSHLSGGYMAFDEKRAMQLSKAGHPASAICAALGCIAGELSRAVSSPGHDHAAKPGLRVQDGKGHFRGFDKVVRAGMLRKSSISATEPAYCTRARELLAMGKKIRTKCARPWA